MKKIFLAIMLSVFALVGNSICSAKMPISEMYLGGITLGTSYNEIVRIYGKPTTAEYSTEAAPTDDSNAPFAHYKYCSSVDIYVIGKKIRGITVTENNGWKTPSGIAVDSNISDVLDLYGNPDYTESGNFKTAYCYFGEMYYDKDTKSNSPEFGFIILFNKNSGKILQMEINKGDWGIGFGESEHYKDIMQGMVK